MNLSDQVCSLELSKRLKELGCKQDGYFAYCNVPDIDGFCYEENIDTSRLMTKNSAILKCGQRNSPCIISAYTVAELGALIPFSIQHKDEGTLFCNQMIGYTKHGYHPTISYNTSDEDSRYGCEVIVQDFGDANEANARAKMLIWLIENGHVKYE